MGQNDPYGQPQGGQPQYGQPQGAQQPVQPPQQYGQPQQPYGQPGYAGGGYPPAPPPRKSKLMRNILIGVALLVVVCGAGGFYIFQLGKGELDAIQKTIDSFMVAGRNDDAATAASYIAQSSKDAELVSDADIASLVARRDLFDGYQSIGTGTSFSVNSSTSNGTTAKVSGNVTYASAPNGTYDAELIKENDVWKLTFINIKRQ